ncbi:MAG: N-acetylmuramoyl-L-alanine amidase [Erysipelotrichaceae bacterium]|nr:N-acetylmuramoyl-L-alanine amidase [Erysipelotrichaceae bacterium]
MIFIIILLIITIVFLVYNIKNFKQEEEIIIERYYYSETVVPSYIDGITITTHFLNKSSDRRPSEHRLIKYIVVHETDNRNIGTGALKHSQYLTSNSDNINGWHYTVDDHIIYHNIPDNEIAWHAGDGRSEDGGNMNGIGIEMAVNVDGDYDKTLENSVKLIVYLMHEYELDINDVKLHKDFSGKICPHKLITENKAGIFYDMIKKEYFLKYQTDKFLKEGK